MAYGARLESVLGESPRGFESPILRRCEGPVTCGDVGGGPFGVGVPEAVKGRGSSLGSSLARGEAINSDVETRTARPDLGASATLTRTS